MVVRDEDVFLEGSGGLWPSSSVSSNCAVSIPDLAGMLLAGVGLSGFLGF